MSDNEFFKERLEYYRAMARYAKKQIDTLEKVIE